MRNKKKLIRGFASSKRIWCGPDCIGRGEWGYHGGGPQRTALMILLSFQASERAHELYQDFYHQIISMLPQDQDWQLTSDQVEAWIADRKRGVHEE